jgi:predicted nucleic acid-binding protein
LTPNIHIANTAPQIFLSKIGKLAAREKACSQPNLIALAAQALDPGEAEVVALALELGTKDVVLDDLDARRFARRSGL